MNVAAEDGLTSVFTTVDAHVKGGNFRVGWPDLFTFSVKQRLRRISLRLVEIEVVGNVPLGDDQGVLACLNSGSANS
jgi:hypothetical protein